MGIIQRQGIKHSIVNFTGLAIATVSTVFLYSRKEVVEAYGLTQFLLSIGIIGFPLFSMASHMVAIRFFPTFQDKESGHHGFLPLILGMCLLGWSICAVAALIFWTPLQALIPPERVLLKTYLWTAFPLTLLFSLAFVLNQYSFNFKRIVIPSILFDFALKVVLPVLILGLLWGWIDLQTVLLLLILHYALVILGTMLYLRQIGEWYWRPNLGFLTPVLRQDVLRYAAYGVTAGFALLMATKADTLMVGSLTSMKNTGIYVIALNIAAAIEIPSKALYSASLSFVARYLADENWTEMRILYQKVSINLLTGGLLIFGGIWVSATDLYGIMPNTEEIAQGKYVLLFLSIAKLVDMAAGLNNQLVYYSRHYRYSLVSLGILAVANVAFNLWLIPRMGITGAAVATLLSLTCYNLSNLFVVWQKFHMQPFSASTASVVGLALLSIGLISFLPDTGHSLLNIVLRSGLFGLLFSAAVIRFRISEDINQLWRSLPERLFPKKLL